MSCQIRLTANLHDIGAIRRCLYPTDDNRGGEGWLQNAHISVSPTGDIIVIANERRLVVLTSKWDSNTSLSNYWISYSGSVHEYDTIKAVLCLPIVGQSQSSHVGPDWTCVMIGYDSGYVRFYTEQVELLFEEQLHCENITNIKCQSQHSPRPDISPELHPEEIYVQYQSILAVISGQHLFSNLRHLRSRLARGDAPDSSQLTLNPRKWGFQDQGAINDAAVVGLNLTSTFDHLLTASTCGGFDTKYRAIAPHNTLVLGAGSKPYLGYHYALEGGAQPVLSDVAKAVASKLKSALPGWLTGTKTQAEKQMTTAMQPAETMGCRFGLCDLRRTGTTVVLSQDRKLAAVTDALGRVLLVDSFRGVTLRVFKGYRDAQVAFVQVPDERKSKHKIGNRVALFLVIYSTKKGTLEFFSVQQGARIATFSASKHSRLLYINYGLMGFVTTTKSRYICQYTVVFMDNDGQIKEFLIPFHFALTEKNNKRAKDIHFYKKLRTLVKSGEFDLEKLKTEAYNTCTELKTSEIQLQTVDLLLNNKAVFPEVALHCLEYFAEKCDAETEDGFKILVNNAFCLIKFYIFLRDSSENLDQRNGNKTEANTTLNLSDKELCNLQKLLDLNVLNDNMKQLEVKVSFSDHKRNAAHDFISAFVLTNPEAIILKPNLDENQLLKASEVAFRNYIAGNVSNFGQLQERISSSKILMKDLFYLLTYYWVNRPLNVHLNLEKEMNNLSSVIYCMVKAAKKEDVLIVDDSISKFWSEIRDILANSSRPFPALTAAILCKNIAQKYEAENALDQSGTSLEDVNIEVLSQENVQWSLLIGKLEDVSLLNIILSNRPVTNNSTLPKLSHERVDVSLKYILQKGKGSVSELVAQWLSKCGVNPRDILINEYVQHKLIEDEGTNVTDNDLTYEEYSEDEKNLVSESAVFKYISRLRTQFPYSLESSNLLANLSWEYALAWQKDIQNLENLEAVMKCLDLIPNQKIKQGLCNLIWNTHLKIVYEGASKLINKVGKLPKERLCRQDTGLSDYQITSFINICTSFMDAFLDVAEKSATEVKPQLHFEPIWENGSQPLVQLCLDQRDVNRSLLHLHYQLSLCLQMIATFAIKHSKPINSLFEAGVVGLFFTDMQRAQLVITNKPDVKLNASRTQFLIKIISASLESVTVTENERIYSAEHVKWMSKCLDLARLWSLDVDMLKRYQVVQLYTSGYDLLAEELLPAINDRRALGSELLAVAAKRTSQYLASAPNLSENISAFSPVLTRYLDTLVGEWCTPSSLQSITVLANHALLCLSEDQSEHKIVQHLLEACSTLEDLEK